jgi:tetratricopeptide (TPR) repeat protein
MVLDPKDFHLKRLQMSLPKSFSLDSFYRLLRNKDYQEASNCVNTSLRSNPQNAYLHTLNGMVYHLMYVQHMDKNFQDLSHVAFQSAYNLDSSKWYFAYLLGQSFCHQKDYRQGRHFFMKALELRPQEPKICHMMACASYCLGDLEIAYSLIDRALRLGSQDVDTHKAAAMIFAACGKQEKAKKSLKVVETMCQGDVDTLRRRMDMLDGFARQCEKGEIGSSLHLVSSSGSTSPSPDTEEGGPTVKGPGDANKKEAGKEPTRKSLILDCYLLRQNNTGAAQRGDNLLKGALKLLWNASTIQGVGARSAEGSSSLINYKGTQGYWFPNSTTQEDNIPGTSGYGYKMARSYGLKVSPSNITYSLKIMDIGKDSVEILARPTLFLYIDQPASFVAGDQIKGAVSGGSAGATSFSVDVGIKVEVKLLSLEEKNGECIARMDIAMLGSNLILTPTTAQVTKQAYYIARASITTQAEVPVGQTVVLGGLYSRLDIRSKNGVPGLRDVPIVQYFFSHNEVGSRSDAILFLATPHYPEHVASMSNNDSQEKADDILVRNKLKKNGLLTIESVPVIHFLLKGMKRSEMFKDVGGTDIAPLNWGKECIDSPNKLKELASFLYF